MGKTGKNIFILLWAMVLSSCASNSLTTKIEEYERNGNPLDAVLELRKEKERSHNEIQIRSLLAQYELKAAEYYYQKGQEKHLAGSYKAAIEAYEKGLTAKPDHDKLLQAISIASAHIEADNIYKEAVKNYQVGKIKDAEQLLLAILESVPDHQLAQKMLSEIYSEPKDIGIGTDSNQKISLNFKNTNIKTAFSFIATAFDINVVFDEGVKDQVITLEAKEVDFVQALNLILTTSDMFYQKIGNNTFLISPDTKSKREQYEEYIIRTFNLRTIQAKEMADIIKGILSVNKLVINDTMNTIMVRDNPTTLNLIEKIIEVNDRKPSELLLEVEILEVNRNKAEQLGFDYGSVITAKLPEVNRATSSIADSIDTATIALPNIVFRYFKQDVDAKTLANPKIRVINRKQAKIHIGDRVPLRSSTIQNATGQTQTSYEYSDIGIRLDVEPIIHFDNSVTVKVNLEVSSLGQNLGSPDEPTYSIGTRNTQTYMLLRDGETAIIGGLIRDEDRSNEVSVPGFGSIPLIGYLFRSSDDSVGRTDVLLTITPKIVRGWDIPRKSLRAIYSGTAERYSSEPAFGNTGGGMKLNIENTKVSSAHNEAVNSYIETATQSLNDPKGYFVSFDNTLYESDANDTFTVKVAMNSLEGLSEVNIPVMLNKEIVEIEEVSAISDSIADFQKSYTDDGLMIKAMLKESTEKDIDKPLFNIKLKGAKTGISYLTVKQAVWNKKNGEKGEVESNASRIVIK